MSRTVIAVAVITLLMLATIGCGDDAAESAEILPSPNTSASELPDSNPTRQPDTSTPAPPDKPVVNVQFVGAADLSDESKSSLADVIESIQASVVQIVEGESSGSGFIVSEDGLVVTNEHVVDNARTVRVWLTNGRSYEADVLERDSTSDLALVKIGGNQRFEAIPVGDLGRVRVGDEVLALGFPLVDRIGNNLTVTRGIVSSKRTEAGVDLLQTDAAINPGNSGGPLVNGSGEVIGVNTSRIEETSGGRPVANIGFAVSISEIERRLPTLAARGVVNRGTLTAIPTITPTSTMTPTPTITSMQGGEFASVSAGGFHTCGVKTDGSVQCWDYAEPGQSTPPGREFASVSAGYWHTCGVKTDGSIQCWGDDEYGQSTPPHREFASVSAGGGHTCGVKTDSSVQCWGWDDDGRSTPPGGKFTSVSAGLFHTCGVKTDGSVQCWGWDDDGRSTPPRGEFASVSAGFGHTCGVKTDGSVQCWGRDDYGQSTPPRGEFVSVSAGGGHTCGVKTDGSIQCWGDDGRSMPPGGGFASVSAGWFHTCGVQEDGIIVCGGILDWEGS